MFCGNCGREMIGNTRFCQYCGAEQTATVIPGAAAPSQAAAPEPPQEFSAPVSAAEPATVSSPVSAPVSTPAPAPMTQSASATAVLPTPNEIPTNNLGAVAPTVSASAGTLQSVSTTEITIEKDDKKRKKEAPERKYSLRHIVMCLATAAVMAVAAGVFAGLYFSVI